LSSARKLRRELTLILAEVREVFRLVKVFEGDLRSLYEAGSKDLREVFVARE